MSSTACPSCRSRGRCCLRIASRRSRRCPWDTAGRYRLGRGSSRRRAGPPFPRTRSNGSFHRMTRHRQRHRSSAAVPIRPSRSIRLKCSRLPSCTRVPSSHRARHCGCTCWTTQAQWRSRSHPGSRRSPDCSPVHNARAWAGTCFARNGPTSTGRRRRSSGRCCGPSSRRRNCARGGRCRARTRRRRTGRQRCTLVHRRGWCCTSCSRSSSCCYRGSKSCGH